MQYPFDYLSCSAPGRICLFGEHQDYLGLPVIAQAINLRIHVSGTPIATEEHKGIQFIIHTPDLANTEPVIIEKNIGTPFEPRDYLRSSIFVLKKHYNNIHSPQEHTSNQKQFLEWNHPYEITIKGTIPINAGCGSSSAMIVAWIKFLLELSNHPDKNDSMQIAKLAHQAEVTEFQESGGWMDHVTSAFGNMVFIDPKTTPQPTNSNTDSDSDSADFSITKLNAIPGEFVLGNSMEPKDTVSILKRVKTGTIHAVNTICEWEPTFSIREYNLKKALQSAELLPIQEKLLVHANIRNYDFTKQALILMQNHSFNPRMFGALLCKHQEMLSLWLQVSTPKLDGMCKAAQQAGALGSKINGSGGGGCMFAYTQREGSSIAKAIEKVQGTAYLINADEGVRVDSAKPKGEQR